MGTPDPKQPPDLDGSASPPTNEPDEVIFRAVAASRSYEQVVHQIEDAIRSGQFQLGQRLPTERQLAESFGVSRGVVREAVKVLGAMGLVDARQGSGLYVRNDTIPTVTRGFILSVSPDAESVDRLFEFRRVLEMESARLAALNADANQILALREALAGLEHCPDPIGWDAFSSSDGAFHALIAEAAGNPYLEVAIAATREMQQDVVLLIASNAGSMRAAIGQHRRILDAIEAHESERAAQAMAEHVVYTSNEVHSKFDSSSLAAMDGDTAREHA